MSALLNAAGHFKKVMTHKRHVFRCCVKAGMPWRGLKHDMSKLSPTEFFESVRYYVGTDSPINECKRVNGYSKGWLHHKGRNDHHYEYWQDNFDKGGESLQMPFKCALEQMCDYVGAGVAYNGRAFTYQGELDWWMNRTRRPIAMHPKTRVFTEVMLQIMAEEDSDDVLRKKRARVVYDMVDDVMQETEGK